MRRTLAGAFVLALGIALPLTLQGSAFLTVLWLVIVTSGVLLVVTSEPIKRRVLDKLRGELGLASGAAADIGELREAVALLSAELEEAKSVLESLDHSYFDKQPSLPVWAYTQKGTVLARHGEMEVHKAVRTAYRRIEDVNRSIDYYTDPEPMGEDIKGQFINEASAGRALPAIKNALAALHGVRVTDAS